MTVRPPDPQVSAAILIVEDEPAIAESLAYALRRSDFGVTTASRLQEAWAQIDRADLIVLDLMLPDGSGFDLIRRVRQEGRTQPIIVLSSRDGEGDRIRALEDGADDYVVKPFSPREVVARVRAVLRRLTPKEGVPDPASRFALDAERREARIGRQVLELTRVEFDLLQELSSKPGKVFTRAELIDRVWGAGFRITDRTVDSHIKALRKKINDAGESPDQIETVRGVGYRIIDAAS